MKNSIRMLHAAIPLKSVRGARASEAMATRVQRHCQDYESWLSFLQQKHWDDVKEFPCMANEVANIYDHARRGGVHRLSPQ